MTCRGVPNWPPVWLGGDNNDLSPGDPSVVTHVITDKRDHTKCFLIVEQNGLGHVGLLKFDDFTVCTRIATILRKYTGCSIADIGDINLTSSL
jgi:hypothetical protein